jgi:hypothetical protein
LVEHYLVGHCREELAVLVEVIRVFGDLLGLLGFIRVLLGFY